MTKQLILALALAGGAMAQVGYDDRRYDDRRYDNRGYGGYGDNRGFGRGYANNGRNGYDPVRATIGTLQGLQQRARVDRHEFNHMQQATEKLMRFDDQRMRGRFDRGALDSALGDLRDLAKADQLHPRDRQRIAGLVSDLYRLREYRY